MRALCSFNHNHRCPSPYLSVCHSVCPTRIYDKIYKLFMSIYPPGGRYVYVFTIQYASSSQKKEKFKFGTLVHNICKLGFFYYTICKFFPQKKIKCGTLVHNFCRKKLVHNFGILAQNFGTLTQNFGTLV